MRARAQQQRKSERRQHAGVHRLAGERRPAAQGRVLGVAQVGDQDGSPRARRRPHRVPSPRVCCRSSTACAFGSDAWAVTLWPPSVTIVTPQLLTPVTVDRRAAQPLQLVVRGPRHVVPHAVDPGARDSDGDRCHRAPQLLWRALRSTRRSHRGEIFGTGLDPAGLCRVIRQSPATLVTGGGLSQASEMCRRPSPVRSAGLPAAWTSPHRWNRARLHMTAAWIG